MCTFESERRYVIYRCRPAIPGGGGGEGRHSEGSAIFNLRLGIRLGLGLRLRSVVWLWQYQELFRATITNDGFQNDGPFGMADPNRFTSCLNLLNVILSLFYVKTESEYVLFLCFFYVNHQYVCL